MSLVLKIALGIALGATLIFAGRLILITFFFDQMTEQTTKMLNDINKQSQERAAQMQDKLNKERERRTLAELEKLKNQPEKVWIPGKSIHECMGPEKLMNEAAVACTKDRWEYR